VPFGFRNPRATKIASTKNDLRPRFHASCTILTERSWRIPLALPGGALVCALLVGCFFCDPVGIWQWIMD
jgi:hypothetical protein